MARPDAVRALRLVLPVMAAVPLSWSLSKTWVGELVLELFNSMAGTTLSPVLPTLFLGGLLTLVGILAIEGTFKLVTLQFLMFFLPTLWGTPLSALRGYTLGGAFFSIALIAAYYLDSPSLRSKFPGLSPAPIVETLRALLIPLFVGIAFLVLILYWSDLGTDPRNALPLWALLPLLFGVTFLVATGYSMHGEKPDGGKDVPYKLVLRTVMTAGDTFKVEPLGEDARSVTLTLTGGSPIKRPILMTLEVDWVPALVVLRSPWETKVLTKKHEWVEKGVRYVVYSDTTSRAPSSPDSASAPR